MKGLGGYGWTMYSVQEVRESLQTVLWILVELILAHMLKMLE